MKLVKPLEYANDGYVGECLVEGCDQNHVPNIPLLRKILDAIRNDPTSWYQGTWTTRSNYVMTYLSEEDKIVADYSQETICKTAYCIAGHAMAMSGEVAEEADVFDIFDSKERMTRMVPSVDWAAGARHLLGLSEQQAVRLFAGTNEWHHVVAISEEIAQSVGDTF